VKDEYNGFKSEIQMVVVNFKLLSPSAKLPVYSHGTDAGIDFFSDEVVSLVPGQRHTTATGVAWMPYFNDMAERLGYSSLFKIYMKIEGRSGLASNEGIDVMAGVVDGSYRGEIKIVLKNSGDFEITLAKGSKIAQGIVQIIPMTYIKLVNELIHADRGTSGFGSTGMLGQ
jgi:dUTP pyrophosphatase